MDAGIPVPAGHGTAHSRGADGRSHTDQFSISELRVFHGGAELPRAPAWRLHAEPNPWEIQLAFDNTPVTRWRTWQPIEGGEFVQMDFGRAQTFDRVLLECARDQYKIKLKLEGMDEGGRWQTLAPAPQANERPPSVRSGSGWPRKS